MNLSIAVVASFALLLLAAGQLFVSYTVWSTASIGSTFVFAVLSVAVSKSLSNFGVKIWLWVVHVSLLMACSFALWLYYALNSNLALLAFLGLVVMAIAITIISIVTGRNS